MPSDVNRKNLYHTLIIYIIYVWLDRIYAVCKRKKRENDIFFALKLHWKRLETEINNIHTGTFYHKYFHTFFYKKRRKFLKECGWERSARARGTIHMNLYKKEVCLYCMLILLLFFALICNNSYLSIYYMLKSVKPVVFLEALQRQKSRRNKQRKKKPLKTKSTFAVSK